MTALLLACLLGGCSREKEAAKATAEANAAVEAKAAEARAAANETARLATEAQAKRLEWTGASLRRAGFAEPVVQRLLTAGGTVQVFGQSPSITNAPKERLTSVVAIAAGTEHVLALRADGTVVGWGSSSEPKDWDVYNALSRKHAGVSGTLAVQNLSTTEQIEIWKMQREELARASYHYGAEKVPEGLNGVVAIAAGGFMSLALKSDGTVVHWGQGSESAKHTVPSGLAGVVAIAAARYNCYAVKSNGAVVGWSSGAGKPAVPAELNDVIAITAAHNKAIAPGKMSGWEIGDEEESAQALKRDGTLVTWGTKLSKFGEVKNMTVSSRKLPNPAQAFPHPPYLIAQSPSPGGVVAQITRTYPQGSLHWAASLRLEGVDLNPPFELTLLSGEKLTGTLYSPDSRGCILKLPDGKFRSGGRIYWTNLTAESLQVLSADGRSAPYVEKQKQQ